MFERELLFTFIFISQFPHFHIQIMYFFFVIIFNVELLWKWMKSKDLLYFNLIRALRKPKISKYFSIFGLEMRKLYVESSLN